MNNTSWLEQEIPRMVMDHEKRLIVLEVVPPPRKKQTWTEGRSSKLAAMVIAFLILVNILSLEKIKAIAEALKAMKDLL